MIDQTKKHKSAEDYANAALGFLQTRSWVFNTNLANGIGVATTSRDTFGKAMQRLLDNDVVRRSGKGKYSWKINVATWDTYNPFKRQTEKPAESSYGEKPYSAYDPNQPDEPEAETEEEKYDTNSQEIDSLRYRVKELESGSQSLNERVNAKSAEVGELKATVAALTKKIEEAGRFHKTVEFKKYDGKSVTLKNVLLPKVFDRVRDLVRCRRPVMLVGPAGCGKTHLAKLVSDSLGFERFGSLSCTEGATESHLFGRGVPNLAKGVNNFEGTEFLDCFENGGLFLLDEIDAANANFLLSLNTSLANGYATILSRAKNRRAVKHPDFCCIAAANTFGKGATRQYVGRNQLDDATLDRFRIGMVQCDYDDAVEQHLCPDDTLRNAILAIRTKVQATGMLRIVSTRFMMDSYVMHKEAGWTVPMILETLVTGWSKEEVAKVMAA
jgi:cobaltochelatase CobS